MHSDIAEPGYYRTRFVKGGVWVPCRVWLDDAGGDMQAEVNGRACEIEGRCPKGWPWHPLRGGKDEYDFMVKDARYCEWHAPDDPKATPFEPVDIRKMKVPI